MLNHPEIAKRSCDECERYVFGNRGELSLHPRTRKPLERREYGPWCTPDCSACPKCDGMAEKSPRIGRMAELSRKNAATLALYYEAQACHGIDCDSLLRRNLGVIHGILEANRRGREKAMLELLAVLRVR